MSSAEIAVYLIIGMVSLAFVILALFSLRSIANGKHSIFNMLIMIVLPVVVFGIAYMVAGQDIAKAAVFSIIGMFGIGVGVIFLTGLRGLFR